jgi:superfamily I DNA/RNA helicase/RecB family exonuclease
VVLLRRAPALVVDAPSLDDEQRAALAARTPVLRVLGAPGTGKTTTAVELVVDRVLHGGLTPDECLLLTPTRVAAARLRERVTTRLSRTSTEPLARTHQAFGFGILRREAALRGDDAPRLISGPEQDVILRDLLDGHARGDAPRPPWPEHVLVALDKRGFRAELRDLLMRAVEHGIEADRLAGLGAEHGRPEWVAAAQVLREYDEVTAFSRPGAYDPAWILTAAADLLEDDADALARVGAQVRLVVVDDAQELTFAAARLLRVVSTAGPDLVLVGDPDAAVQTFRGADPRILANGWADLGRRDPARAAPWTVVLHTAYRQPRALLDVSRTITTRIGALAGGRQRSPEPLRAGGDIEVALLRSPAQEAAHIAARLRAAHLLDGVPWGEMAVVVRSEDRDEALRRILMAHGVPMLPSASEAPVRDEVAVRPLLALVDVVLSVALKPDHEIEPERAIDLVLSPLGECDAVGLRRLRRLLRREELDTGGERSSDELLAAILLEPGHATALGHDATPVRRLATAIDAGLRVAKVVETDGVRTWAAGVNAETVLWAVWEALDVAPRWSRLALRGGKRGARADRDLDAVVGLFDAAQRYVDRLPAAGPDAFLEHVQGQDVPGDTLAARAQSGDGVALLTPAGAAGREWRFVAVAGVQEGVWPDLRLRGSLLGSEELVAVVTGRDRTFRAAQTAVRYDETRLFLVAVSRASERLLVTAVRSEDDQPSVYVDLVDPLVAAGTSTDDAPPEQRDFTELARSLSLPALVADLRRRLVLSGSAATTGDAVDVAARTDVGALDSGVAAAAAAALARLAAAGIDGADPRQWWVQRVLSDDRPLRRPEQQVRLSPSKVESFGDCRLRWALTSAGGDAPSHGSANLGTLIHDIAHDLGDDVDADTLVAEVERRWGRLGLPPGWATDRQREQAYLMARRLATYLADSGRPEKVGSEVPLRVDVGRATISGRVDRLEREPDGGLRVLDYKTGSSKPKVDEVATHPQLGTYQLAVESGAFGTEGRTSAGAALLHLGKAAGTSGAPALQQQEPLAGQDDPEWAARLVAATADGMGGAQFAATPGSWCTFCPVKTSCPAMPEGSTLR